jgi:hypothetical protein
VSEHTPPRLVVAIEGDEDDPALLEAAIRLAARLERELVGLFIEDEALMAAIDLPVARFVGHGGATMGFDPAGTRRMLKVQVERVRDRFSLAATRHSVRFSFEIVRGDQGLARLRAGDVFATGPRLRAWRRAEPAAAPPPCPTVLIGRGGGPIVLVYEGGAASLELAALLASVEGHALVVLCVASGLASAEERVHEAERRLGKADAKALAVLAVTSDEPEYLVPAIRAWRPSIVVADTCRTDTRLRAAVRALSGVG